VEGIGPEYKAPVARWVREGGREVRGWEKESPRVRWVSDGGRRWTGWLNSPDAVR
jgi:hypothetical protein